MIGLAIKLAWGRVSAFFAKYPWQTLCLLLAAYGLWEHHRASGWADYAHSLERASAASLANLKAHKAETEAAHTAITKETDDATPANRDRAVAALDRWADARRVQSPAVHPAREAGTSLPEPAAPAGSPQASGEAIAVDRAALTACALNSADLDTAVEWARKTWGTE